MAVSAIFWTSYTAESTTGHSQVTFGLRVAPSLTRQFGDWEMNRVPA